MEELTVSQVNELMKPRRRVMKIKTATEVRPNSGGNRSYVIVRIINDDGTTTLEKHYRKINTINDSGFFTTTDKHSPTKTARWVGGKSKNNPRFMPPADSSVVAYFAATATTSGFRTDEEVLGDEIARLLQ